MNLENKEKRQSIEENGWPEDVVSKQETMVAEGESLGTTYFKTDKKMKECENICEEVESCTIEGDNMEAPKLNMDITLKLSSSASSIGPLHLISQSNSISSVTTTSSLCQTSINGFKTTCTKSDQESSTSVNTLRLSPLNKTQQDQANERKNVSGKRTEKFIVKNVGKVSKLFKVSNLNYRIKPVRQIPEKKLQFPVIFVGEPAFIGPENLSISDTSTFTHEVASNTTLPPEIKEESLYSITSMKNAFIPPVDRDKGPLKTVTVKMPCTYPDAVQPSFIPKTELLPLINVPDYCPSTSIINSVPTLNIGYRIVARTVPSATIAQSNMINSISSKNPIGINLNSYRLPFPSLKIQTPLASSAISNKISKPRNILKPKLPITVAPNLSLSSSSKKSTVTTGQNIMSSQVKPIQTAVSSVGLVIKSSQLSKRIMPNMLLSTSQNVEQSTKVSAHSFQNQSKLTVAKPGSSGCMSHTLTNTVVVPKIKEEIPTKTPNGKIKVVGIKESATSSVLAKLKHKSPKKNVCVISTTVTNDTKSSLNASSSKYLREGIEVAFEDGVRHFISSLKDVTFLDDELVKSWSQLKKGTKVAAKWEDGFIYDATVIACYFNSDNVDKTFALDKRNGKTVKGMQPVVKLVKIPDKKNMHQYEGKKEQSQNNIGCTGCKEVFSSVILFRKHQKRFCKSPGVIIEDKSSQLTDAILKAAMKHKKVADQYNMHPTKHKNNTVQTIKKSLKRSAKEDAIKIIPKRQRNDSFLSKHSCDTQNGALFKKGTKFLHRWQLDNGDSKWYQGEVTRIVSASKAFLDQEFEVKYKGEDEIYILKLYEDYPTDIRLMTKK